MLTKQQTEQFKRQLNERYEELRGEIREELLRSEDQKFIDLAGQVHDLEEASLADLLVDLDLTVLDLQVDEVRDIDAALVRIVEGSFGICLDCDDDIPVDRLRAYPTAKRCRSCQERYEHSHAGPTISSL